MKNQVIKILAIETSCDETAAAVIAASTHEITNQTKLQNYKSNNGAMQQWSNYPVILSNVVSSQVDLHAITGGVVPEVASRAHVESIIPVIVEALAKANNEERIMNNGQNTKNLQANKLTPDLLLQITHIAVTNGPGLIGSLLVGFNTAKSLAYALGVPIVPVNHIEGHIYSAFSGEISKSEFLISNEIPNLKSQIPKANEANEAIFPILALTVSGGHTSLTLMHDHGKYETIGQTLDDAAGEAFDKVAKLLNLGYPGGPALSKTAAKFRKDYKKTGVELPLPLKNDPTYNFSYSGLKTSVLIQLRKAEKEYQNDPKKLELFKKELACVFEETAVAHLIDKTLKAAKKHGIKSVLLAGGVSANKYLRENLKRELDHVGVSLIMPPTEMTGDNAAMIGLSAYYHILRGDISTWNETKVDSNLKL